MPNAASKPLTDVRVTPDGTVWGFRALTPAGEDWIDNNVATESYQWLGDTMVVDYRFAGLLIEGMNEAGLSVHVVGH